MLRDLDRIRQLEEENGFLVKQNRLKDREIKNLLVFLTSFILIRKTVDANLMINY